jgi:hypothetical protein
MLKNFEYEVINSHLADRRLLDLIPHFIAIRVKKNTIESPVK